MTERKKGPRKVANLPLRFDLATRTKLCARCHTWKSMDDFYPTTNTSSGCRYACKECFMAEQQRRKKGLPIQPTPPPPYHFVRPDGTKLCSICKLLKEAEKNFYFHNGRYTAHCRACQYKMIRDKRARDGLPPRVTHKQEATVA